MWNFDWLSGVSMETAKAVFLVLFVLIGIAVLWLPREEIYEGVENPRWYHNLKLWAIVVLGMIFVTYWIF